MRQCQTPNRLRLQQTFACYRIDRKSQLEILAIAQRMLQGRLAILQRCRRWTDGNGIGEQNRPAAAFLAEMEHIRAQPVADIDHGVKGGMLLQLQRLTNTRREIEMLAEDAAA